MDFDQAFETLTSYKPLSWQRRLHTQFLQSPEVLPGVLDLPTGLGKTSAMAIWLIALLEQICTHKTSPGLPDKRLPLRLVYVVDRRTVVDQATKTAEDIQKNLPALSEKYQLKIPEDWLAISTLRGQHADNRKWTEHPDRPAIVIGTVDLIGSGLLFSGYRSSFKRRPLEAGMLGQDSLLILDEAHLSRPFAKLIDNISGKFQRDHAGKLCGSPMHVIHMSATIGQSAAGKPPFTLQFDASGNLTDKDAKDPVITERFSAKKRLTITPLGEKDDLKDELAKTAIELIKDPALCGERIVIFVRKPDDAKTIAKAIREHVIESIDNSGPKPQKIKKKPYAYSVEVLTGTMRGLERDKLLEKPVLKRFLDGDEKPGAGDNKKSVFLVSTSAGEVGFDLNADHMVCDAAPLDSMIQRLGRVNRRGNGDATVILIREKKPADKTDDFDKACITASTLLTDGMDVSPKALVAFKSNLPTEQFQAACIPDPTMVELTDILLDAWSMTSLTEPMPGRPEVAPWLRGIDDERPQTTIAWRAELDLFKDDPDPRKAFKAIFARHPIRPHESLTTNSYNVVAFLNGIKKKRPDLLDTRVVIKRSREILLRTIRELIDDNGILNADTTLIFPATLGGLADGMLSHETITQDNPPPASLDVADNDGYELREDAHSRLRILIERTDDGGWQVVPLPHGAPIPADLDLAKAFNTSSLLSKAITKTDLRVRLVQPVAYDDENEEIRSLVLLAPVRNKSKKEDQSLTEHVSAVEAEAKQIADTLGLSENDPIRIAVLFAAKWHDEGKKADIWQRFVFGPNENGQPLGKAASTRDPKSLRGYRHEFGSLLRIQHPERHNTKDCDLPADSEIRDLALHLIATHHGFGRPHFEVVFDSGFTSAESDAIHLDAIRRFARLQRKYGWWHLAWLENLLRCADALASASQESEDDPDDVTGEEGGTKWATQSPT